MFDVNKERVQSRTTHVSVGSEPSWRVEVVVNENGGGGGRRGELGKGREVEHEKRRDVERTGEAKEKDLGKGQKGDCNSSRSRLPLLGGRRYVYSSPKGGGRRKEKTG